MPWTGSKELPDAAKDLTSAQKEVFRSVANSMLEDGASESEAIAAGISQAKKVNKSMDKQSLIESFSEWLDKHFAGSSQEDEVKTENVAKAVDTEKKLFTAVVLRPDVPDAHGDIYDADTVEKACHNFVEFSRKANIQHLIETDDIVFVENYVAPQDFQLGDGMVMKGDWVATAKVNNDEIWEMCKKGIFTGFSVGCLAQTEKLNDE